MRQWFLYGGSRGGAWGHVAVGEADEWLSATKSVVQDCAIAGTCVVQVWSGLKHAASLREGEELWKILSQRCKV